jgi:hypothetical protein
MSRWEWQVREISCRGKEEHGKKLRRRFGNIDREAWLLHDWRNVEMKGNDLLHSILKMTLILNEYFCSCQYCMKQLGKLSVVSLLFPYIQESNST